ncbi:NAD-binding protein [Mycobacterium kyorinense]|uniref:NAD-binding protein n=1 Tax=Mycobacterium kyorinense TaxID=487514 RepID=UPI000AB0675A|nr:NAD-binding protein [Mycobacterium kyorinense]
MTVHQKVLTALTHPRWYWVLAPAGIAAFLLGCLGYWSYKGEHHSVSDVIYGSLKLFFLHAAPQPENHVGLALDIARFLAPFAAGWAALIALVSLFRDRVQQMLIPLKRGHIVVCGLGDVGFEFVRQLHSAGYRVVVVEADGANPHIKACRDWGYPVIVGDAQLKSTLHAAGLKHAARLLAVTPDSVVNTEIVIGARRLAGDRSGRRPLRCLARIDDPGLCVLLRITESNRGDDESALDFFNTDEIGARLLLDAHPVDTQRQPHILVAHVDALAVELVFHAARKSYDERPNDAAPLLVSIVDDHADEQVSSLLAQHPALEEACEFHCYSTSARDIDRLAATDRDRRAGQATAAEHGAAPPISRAYVAGDRDEHSVKTALNLRRALDVSVPVVAVLSNSYGVADLLENKNAPDGMNITVFKTLQETCSVELVEGGSFESVAHEIHRRYCQMQAMDAEPPPPWSQLDDSLKESSRAQARHIGVKLRTIGCEITPLRDWCAKDFTFTDDELQKLTLMEHDRWMMEKITAGWTLGEEDKRRKKDPHLVPWEELPADVAEWDRNFVKAIPELLAAVGLQIIDVRQTAPRYPDHPRTTSPDDVGRTGIGARTMSA